ncbi:MAG: Lrp/AsnC family transcriptional regulator [Flavobacteriaceae bacterium]|nr:Lrp/AsnC family transcriptional regulator [Flavobacteriaceae bacterium]
MNIDSVNFKILSCLQSNSRQTNTAIAKLVGISSPAVAERIRKLEDAGIIQGYKTKISSHELGFQLRAIVTMRAFMGKLKPFLSKVKTFDEVINCYRVTGNENIVMEVILKNQKHLEQFIDELITYGETKTQIILSAVIEDQIIKAQKHVG